jgi:hypothetical protein
MVVRVMVMVMVMVMVIVMVTTVQIQGGTSKIKLQGYEWLSGQW